MDYKFIGKIVSTHGIKGELKIISNLEYKDKLFKENTYIYLGDNKEKHQIKSYRIHKNYDLITLDNLNNINDVLKYINLKVYKDRKDILLNDGEFFYDDLIGYDVIFNNNKIGKIVDYDNNTPNLLYKIAGDKNFYIPINGPFIKNINHKNKEIIVEDIGGLL